MSLLDEAASGFNASSGGKDLGSDDDVIYGGNVSAWKKAVNAIKLELIYIKTTILH